MNTEADFINIFRSDLEIEIKNKVLQCASRDLRISDIFCSQSAVFMFFFTSLYLPAKQQIHIFPVTIDH